MKLLVFAAALLLAACGSSPVEVTRLDEGEERPPSRSVELLRENPQHAYQKIARLEVRGRPGAPRWAVYEQLREKARSLGADAVVTLSEERKRQPAPPLDHEPRVTLGNAYPLVLESLDRGTFPYEGEGPSTVGGVYWEVEALAIAYGK
jgi:hypothetical protein